MISLPLQISPHGKIRYEIEDQGYETPCWIWKMAENGNGYPVISTGNGEVDYAHRYFYENLVDDILFNFLVHHKCEVTLCVNPDHLEAKTSQSHAQYHEFGRKSCEPGCKCSLHLKHWQKRIKNSSKVSKLNEEKVIEIRSLCAEGLDRGRVAEKFGVARNTICNIVNYKAWAHVK